MKKENEKDRNGRKKPEVERRKKRKEVNRRKVIILH